MENNFPRDPYIIDFDKNFTKGITEYSETKCLTKKINKIMDTKIPIVSIETKLDKALTDLSSHHVLFVGSDANYCMITPQALMDFVSQNYATLKHSSLRGISLTRCETIDCRKTVLFTVKYMRTKNISSMIVTEGGKIASGYITLDMLTNYIHSNLKGGIIHRKSCRDKIKDFLESIFHYLLVLIFIIVISPSLGTIGIECVFFTLAMLLKSVIEFIIFNSNFDYILILYQFTFSLVVMLIFTVPILRVHPNFLLIIQVTYYIFLFIKTILMMTFHKAFLTYFRKQVGRYRRRLYLDNNQIDLSYITKRIAAMSFPSQGIEAMYRNSIKDISLYLSKHHNNNYCVYNLSMEKEYNYLFFKKVNLLYRFPDHNVPPLTFMFHFCEDAEKELEKPLSCIVVHCKGGKGRTGLMICALLIHSGYCHGVKEALYHFAKKRSTKELLKKRTDSNINLVNDITGDIFIQNNISSDQLSNGENNSYSININSVDNINNKINSPAGSNKSLSNFDQNDSTYSINHFAMDFDESDQNFNLHSNSRYSRSSIDISKEGVQRVSGRSQLRYLSYFYNAFHNPSDYNIYQPKAMLLKSVLLGKMTNDASFYEVVIIISQYYFDQNHNSQNHLTEESLILKLGEIHRQKVPLFATNKYDTLGLDTPLEITGDFKVSCIYDQSEIFFFWLNTCFVDGRAITLTKPDLDVACGNSRILDSFYVSLEFT